MIYIINGYLLGLHDMLHVIFNAHLVSKAGPVISGNFHHMRDVTWSSIYHTKPLFTDKLHKSWFIMNMVPESIQNQNLTTSNCTCVNQSDRGIMPANHIQSRTFFFSSSVALTMPGSVLQERR